MNDLRKAAEMALEALEEAASCVQNSYLPDSMGHDWDEQIDALRQALNVDAVNMTPKRVDEMAKSGHEPVAWAMTLRDYFAAKAMQVILKDQYEDGMYVGDQDNNSEHICANSAYVMADAMLKARMEKNHE